MMLEHQRQRADFFLPSNLTSPWEEVCTQKSPFGSFTLGDDTWIMDLNLFVGEEHKVTRASAPFFTN